MLDPGPTGANPDGISAPRPTGNSSPQPGGAQPPDPSANPPSADPAATADALVSATTSAEERSADDRAQEERADGLAPSSLVTAPHDPRADWYDDDIEKHPALQVLREQFSRSVLAAVRFRNETTIHVAKDDLGDICRVLRRDERTRLDFLSDLTALDMLRLRETPRFDVVVQLYSLRHRTRLRLKAGVNDGESVPSLVPVWNGANWMERECYDMFGVVFDGHPNPRRILLAEDWSEGHPLRKDYPLRGWSEYPVYNTERTVPRIRTRWTGRTGTS